MLKIITIGEILVEIMAKNIGQDFLQPGEFLGPYPSGAPAIFIDQAARMGAACGIVARVGEDDFGLLNIARLKQDGVDTSRIRITPGYTTGTAFVTYFPDGNRKFIFHFAHSAAGMMRPEDIEEDYLKEAIYLHVMGCSLSASDGMRQAILKAIAIAKKHQIQVTFDPNIRPELLTGGEINTVFSQVLKATDILLTGRGEALALTVSNTLETAIFALKSRGIKTIVIKDGAHGVRVYHDQEIIRIPSFPAREIDPTGAGDCFDGAFLASLSEGKDVRQAAIIANAAGALSVSQKGPMEGAAFKENILRFLADVNHTIPNLND